MGMNKGMLLLDVCYWMWVIADSGGMYRERDDNVIEWHSLCKICCVSQVRR